MSDQNPQVQAASAERQKGERGRHLHGVVVAPAGDVGQSQGDAMPKLDLDAITPSNATGYPDPFHQEVQGRWWKRIAPAAGLTELGASHVALDPGAWSSQRHWHRKRPFGFGLVQAFRNALQDSSFP